MSRPATIDSLPTLSVNKVGNNNTFYLKDKMCSGDKEDFDLKSLFYMDYKQLNDWIVAKSGGKYFLPKPKNANIVDTEVCLFKSAHTVIFRALQNEMKRRKNGRDKQLLLAYRLFDFCKIASILTSSVRSYWLDAHKVCGNHAKRSSNYN